MSDTDAASQSTHFRPPSSFGSLPPMAHTSLPADAASGAASYAPVDASRGPTKQQVDAFYEQYISDSGTRQRTLVIVGLANAADASEIIAISYVLDAFKENTNLTSLQEALLGASMFGGMLLGGLLLGFLSDRLGRRRILLWTLFLNAVAGLLSAATPNGYLFFLLLCRFIGGIGIGGSIPACFALAAEASPPSKRAKALMWVAWNWVFGSLYTAGAAWVLLGVLGLSWRALAVAAALPALFCTLFTWALVPESPPYLLLHGRFGEARASLLSLGTGYTDWGRAREAAAALEELLPAALTTATAGAAAATGTAAAPGSGSGSANNEVLSGASLRARDGGVRLAFNTGSSGGSGNGRGCCSSFASSLSESCRALASFSSTAKPLYTLPLLTRTLALQAIWAGLSLASYGLALWLPQLLKGAGFGEARYAGAFIFTLAQVPGCGLGTWAIDKPWGGKRRLLVLGASVMAVVGGLFALAGGGTVTDDSTGDDSKDGEQAGGAVWGGKGVALLLICLYQIFSSLVWNSLDVLATVAFPAATRSTAFALQAAAGRVGAIVGQFAFSYLVGVAPGAALWMCAGVMIVVAVVGLGLGDYADKEGEGEDEEEESEASAVVGMGIRSDEAASSGNDVHGGVELTDLEMQDDGL